jgi:hypothetical protein
MKYEFIFYFPGPEVIAHFSIALVIRRRFLRVYDYSTVVRACLAHMARQ